MTILRSLTISLGVATSSRQKPRHVDDLVQSADQALYRAKRKGRNRAEAES
jgi:diguanylate cyclase (GGDEF)-like protein